MRNKIFPLLLYLLLIFVVYKSIVTNFTIAGGDYITLWPEHTSVIISNAFHSWDSTGNLGSSSVEVLHGSPWNYLMGTMGQWLGNDIVITERLFWWIPFLVLSVFSSMYLFKKLFLSNNFMLFSPLIFLFNTYVLMMIGGGQIAGIGLAYAIAPLVLGIFISLCEEFYINENFKNVPVLRKSLIAGLLLALQVVFDYRIAYVTVIALFLYLLVTLLFRSKSNIQNILFLLFYSLVIPFCITGLFHAFWIIPAVFVKNDVLQQLGSGFTSAQSATFFSFAKFENTISLLHPNWPENIFGFVHFMRPEFLFIPILAYVSLLFVGKKNKKESFSILFFAFLGLIGAFFAKGTNDPFGGLYLWMFAHIPGFVMFRDPTKFYLLVALSYSILIPFGLRAISEKVSSSKYQVVRAYGKYVLGLVFIIFWLFTIRQAIFGELNGTFKATVIPTEYVQLKEFLESDNQFSRVLWVPEKQRFGFWSDTHPSVWSYDFYHTTSASATLAVLKNKNAQSVLQDSSIKYLIVPDDTQREIFLADRKYDEKKYVDTIKSLDKISWLRKIKQFGGIVVYEVPSAKEHFWSPSKTLSINYFSTNSTEYAVSVKNAKRGDRLVFSESYAKSWVATIDTTRIPSELYEGRFNSFVLTKDGNYTVDVIYAPQKLVKIGLIISAVAFLLTIGGLFLTRKK